MDAEGHTITRRREAADVVRVLLAGEFDMVNAAELAAALMQAVRDAGVVLVDLGGTTFLDSSAIRAIAMAYEAALDAGRVLRLDNVPAPLRRLFEILEMTVLFEQP